MPTPRKPKRRGSKARKISAKDRANPKRSKKRSPAKKKSAPKKRVAPAKKKPAPKKRAPKRRAKKKPAPKKRSTASKKGWAKRRKKQKIIDAMADLRMKREQQGPNAQPLGWFEHREQLRMHEDGTYWRKIVMTYDQSVVDAKRLEILKELQIDMLNRFDLYDYLSWIAEESDIEIGDMYTMYLGYPMKGE